jgi:putative iron-regulated protein
MRSTLVRAVILIACTQIFAACGGGGGDGGAQATVTEAEVVGRYADLLFANYSDAASDAQALLAAVEAFLADPTPTTFAAAKQAWLDARPVYQQSEIARFYDGPIDNPVDGPEGRVNAWPLDESYVDYVEGNPASGIINDPVSFPAIDRDTLAAANEAGGETDISTGYHAIEFLLWGQDRNADGPGMRPYTDYVTDGTGTAANQDRRAAYLRAAAELLLDDLAQVRDQWAPNDPGNFRAAFVAADPRASLGRMLTGMGSLSGGELAGERLSVAFETRDQEDEHSCFSDNTHVDHLYDELGIQNVYLGRYGGVDGVGIDDLVRQIDPDLDARMQAELQASLIAIDAIPQPFDQAILGADDAPGRVAIAAAIDALFTQSDTIAEVAEALDVGVTIQ